LRKRSYITMTRFRYTIICTVNSKFIFILVNIPKVKSLCKSKVFKNELNVDI